MNITYENQFMNEPFDEYPNHIYIPAKGYPKVLYPTLLIKLVLLTQQYPHLVDFIDNYINLNKSELNKTDSKGYTPLMIASINVKHRSSIKTVEILLKHGADVNLKNYFGETALHLACSYTYLYSDIQVIKLLLQYGSDINAKTRNWINFTPLYYAIVFNSNDKNYDVVKLLLENNADYKSNLYYGRSLLQICCMYGLFNNENGDENRNGGPKTLNLLLDYDRNIYVTYKNLDIVDYYLEYCKNCLDCDILLKFLSISNYNEKIFCKIIESAKEEKIMMYFNDMLSVHKTFKDIIITTNFELAKNAIIYKPNHYGALLAELDFDILSGTCVDLNKYTKLVDIFGHNYLTPFK